MAELSETSAYLRFLGDDLDPAHVTSVLGVELTEGRVKGSIWHLPNGKLMFARTGSWVRKVEPREPGDLDAQVGELLRPLSVDTEVWQMLSRLYNGSVCLGLFMLEGNEGLSLLPENLMLLGLRGLSVEMGIYDRSFYDRFATQNL